MPLKSALGRKRTRVVALAASRRAARELGAPNGAQFVPLSIENCHVPLVLSTAITAMP